MEHLLSYLKPAQKKHRIQNAPQGMTQLFISCVPPKSLLETERIQILDEADEYFVSITIDVELRVARPENGHGL
eukprot:scaffold148519_cov29-Prasinocladus_malaysianus.AAC.1